MIPCSDTNPCPEGLGCTDHFGGNDDPVDGDQFCTPSTHAGDPCGLDLDSMVPCAEGLVCSRGLFAGN